MTGYIKLYRRLLEDPLWTQAPDAWLRVALAVLLRATWKPAKWYDGRQEITLAPGQLVTSRESMCRLARVTPKQCRSAIQYLTNTGFLGQQRASRYTVLTISNWDTYQGSGDLEGRERATKGPDEGQMRATSEEVKKLRREESSSSAPECTVIPREPTEPEPMRTIPNFSAEETSTAAERLRAVSGLKAPTPDELEAILQHFPDALAFETWLEDLRMRGRNQRLQSYSGYAEDARRSAARGEVGRLAESAEDKPKADDPNQQISISAMYQEQHNGEWISLMEGEVEAERIKWVRRESGRNTMTRAELQEWRQKAAQVIPRCPKCKCQGNLGGDFLNPDPCDCYWAEYHGFAAKEATA
jgi:hypothetical protein